MFEGSLVESRGLVASKTQRWSALGSFGVQCAVAALLVVIPMLRPEVLPTNAVAPRITIPQIKPVQIVQHVTEAAARAVAIRMPATQPFVERTSGIIPIHPFATNEAPEPIASGAPSMDDPTSLAPLAVIRTDPASAVVVRDKRPVRVSSGVSAGLLLTPIRPVYPTIARIAGIQGSIVIEATISRTGQVKSLNVVSGPEMLRHAATDAVRAARYAPYQLNGEPVEVQTVITVVFRLS